MEIREYLSRIGYHLPEPLIREGIFYIKSRIGSQNAAEHGLIKGKGIKVLVAHPYPKSS